MIDFLRGIAVFRETDYVVIKVGGIGYRVFCANPYADPLNSGEEVTLYIHYHVRDDATLLYGFLTREEQSLFRRLLDVTGIGPRVAIGILGGGSPTAVITAIQREDIPFLTKLPGIGKKTAQRMILDLKDKLPSVSDDTIGSEWIAGLETTAAAGQGGTLAEAKQALIALGYSEAEADRAVAAARSSAPEGATIDQLLKLCLQALYKG